jgi:hypothetical protein
MLTAAVLNPTLFHKAECPANRKEVSEQDALPTGKQFYMAPKLLNKSGNRE